MTDGFGPLELEELGSGKADNDMASPTATDWLDVGLVILRESALARLRPFFMRSFFRMPVTGSVTTTNQPYRVGNRKVSGSA